MIPVTLRPEPECFATKVREPGKLAIAELVGEKPKRLAGKRIPKVAERRDEIPAHAFPPYWTECLPELMLAYDRVCAFSCFRIHPITGAASVDHMAPKSRRWEKVYEWSNYRLACSKMNARKRNFEDLIDPFEVRDDWFYLELVGFSAYPNPSLGAKTRERILGTIDRLKLNNFRDQRAEDAENLWSGRITFEHLQHESPFVARELMRQDRVLK